MKKILFLCDRKNKFDEVWGGSGAERLCALCGAPAGRMTGAELLSSDADLSEVEYVFSTWGMPALTEEQIRSRLPGLKAVFYAAGTVQAFARPFLDCGVRVFSAWQANAVPVVEYAVSQILLATKGFFRVCTMDKRDRKGMRQAFAPFPGNFGARVGILGDGAIGSRVITELLRHRLEVYVFSITMTPERAAELGVRLCSLDTIFAECDVISNHLANNPQTVGMIGRDLIFSMRPNSTFINTGRGAQADEDALARKLAADPTVTAVLDVTFPEPPLPESPLYDLPNVILTPHMAGSSGLEVRRMAEYMIDEFIRLEAGQPVLYEVTPEMLATMA